MALGGRRKLDPKVVSSPGYTWKSDGATDRNRESSSRACFRQGKEKTLGLFRVLWDLT